MKDGGKGKHIFGEAEWWGKELFGIDNALVGDWPVVVIEDGKAKIKQFKSIPDWWDKHKDLMIKHLRRSTRCTTSASRLGRLHRRRTGHLAASAHGRGAGLNDAALRVSLSQDVRIPSEAGRIAELCDDS